jgi:hypothetical protein
LAFFSSSPLNGVYFGRGPKEVSLIIPSVRPQKLSLLRQCLLPRAQGGGSRAKHTFKRMGVNWHDTRPIGPGSHLHWSTRHKAGRPWRPKTREAPRLPRGPAGSTRFSLVSHHFSAICCCFTTVPPSPNTWRFLGGVHTWEPVVQAKRVNGSGLEARLRAQSATQPGDYLRR